MGRVALSVVPVYGFFVAFKLHLFRHSHTPQGVEHKALLRWGQRSVAASALVVGVAAEALHQYGGETVVLFGKHALLEMGETARKPYRSAVAEERALAVGLAACGVYEFEIGLVGNQMVVGYLVQTRAGFLAIGVQTYAIILWHGGVEFLWHGGLRVLVVVYNKLFFKLIHYKDSARRRQ